MAEHEHVKEHPFHAHHFETAEQQFQAGKLGMWLFLATEVLFFSGMFCAYAIYRAAHPEVFKDAAEYLNSTLGAANTIVLLASSLSVAWAVRCVQKNNQKGLLANLLFTLACAGIFMGVKTVEYGLKFKEGLMWRGNFSYTVGDHPDLTATHEMLQQLGLWIVGVGIVFYVLSMLSQSVGNKWALIAISVTVLGAGGGCLLGNAYTETTHKKAEHSSHADEHHDGEDHEHNEDQSDDKPDGEATSDTQEPAGDVPVKYDGEGPQFLGVFFSIYYAMTGVHAIHILAGIGVFVWVVSRAARGHFNSDNYGPVEYTGLYWHLVDLIWIYLFPLLYLIE